MCRRIVCGSSVVFYSFVIRNQMERRTKTYISIRSNTQIRTNFWGGVRFGIWSYIEAQIRICRKTQSNSRPKTATTHTTQSMH
jgi:hypothetical protein